MIEQKKHQSLTLDNKSYLKVVGVEGVVHLSETDASIIVAGEILEIKGQNLKAEKLSVECGEIILTGEIFLLKYTEKKEKKGLIKRIFK